jgi:hypothetical protein
MKNDCYERAMPDEPTFTLLGRDRHAAVLVNLWAAMRMLDDEPGEVIGEATEIASRMAGYFMAAKPDQQLAGMATLAEGLAALAEMVGVVVTVSQTPELPLAMGNYSTTIEVRKVLRRG